jgi:hypothetical protein
MSRLVFISLQKKIISFTVSYEEASNEIKNIVCSSKPNDQLGKNQLGKKQLGILGTSTEKYNFKYVFLCPSLILFLPFILIGSNNSPYKFVLVPTL